MAAHADFIHLRVRSAYSLSQGAIKLEKLVVLCREMSMPAVAVTDHGNLFGALEFAQYATKEGVQPIIGCDVALRRDDEVGAGGKLAPPPDSLVLLVKDQQGYLNLMHLVTRAHLEFKTGAVSALPWSALEGRTEGLLCLTGWRSGIVGRLLSEGQEAAARQALVRLGALFPDRLYVELQRHGDAAERRIEGRMIDLAYELGLPIVATNDAHFATPDMFEAHDILMCIDQGVLAEDPARRRLSPEHWFKPAAEMRALFADLPEAIDNTLVIARRCAFMPEPRKPILPSYTKLGGRTNGEALRAMAIAGLDELQRNARLASAIDIDQYRKRLDYELDMIELMGFSGYFLIVADFIQWAKDHHIAVGPGRGSGAGSLVAWSLKITDLDPLRWGLLFERFLNPERVSMPDFDIDFCQEKRDRVIRYVRDEYGHDRVAAISTFGKLQARAVLRDVGRVLAMPYGQVDRICKLVPNNPAKPVTLAQARESEPLLREQYDADPQIKRLVDLALRLEGLYRHASTHAAGIVIGDRPLEELVPLFRDSDDQETIPATQFNMKFIETAGLVKFDFLGLKTLTVIEKACELIGNDRIRIDKIPLDDEPTFRMLARGDAYGVFQMEGSGMRDILSKLKPNRFEDLIALVALYRPGPMDDIPTYISVKNGQEKPDYLHPSIKHILEETYGVMVYQEQVMQIAQVLSGYSLGGADLLRRAMGKKIQSEMDAQRASFIEGAGKNNVDATRASMIFDKIAKFAGYGFNKCHSAPYALVAYQTAYLRANYPVEFFAASMTLDMGNTDKLGNFRRELERLQIPLLKPDVNSSTADFTVEAMPDGKKAVRYALAAIKGVGREAMSRLVDERRRGGAFTDLFELAERVDPRLINKRMLENLIRAGALDSIQPNRGQAFASVELALRHGHAAAEARDSRQNSLFAGDAGANRPRMAKVPDWPAMERLQQEFAAIGFYFSSHPLAAYEKSLARLGVARSSEIVARLAASTSSRLKLAGTVIDRAERTSAKGNRFAFVQLSDQSGSFEITVFSEILAAKRNLLEPGKALLITADGRVDGEQVKLTAQTIENLDEAVVGAVAGLRIQVAETAAIAALQRVVAAHKGRGRVSVIFELESDQEAEMSLPGGYAIAPGVRDAIGSIPGVVHVEEV